MPSTPCGLALTRTVSGQRSEWRATTTHHPETEIDVAEAWKVVVAIDGARVYTKVAPRAAQQDAPGLRLDWHRIARFHPDKDSGNQE